MTANQRCLQQVKMHPNPPVATATRPDDSKRPNEAFLNFAMFMSLGSSSPMDLTLKNESPIANLIASAEMTIPMKKTRAERMVRARAGYFRDLKQTHILFYFIRLFIMEINKPLQVVLTADTTDETIRSYLVSF